MSLQLLARIEEAESLIRKAAFSSVTEIPAALNRAVNLLDSVRKDARRCPVQERRSVISRLKQIQANLNVFAAAMERSAGIFRGYARLAGASLEGYGPVGGSPGYRDPAFFNLSV
jgi:hypothetical protein